MAYRSDIDIELEERELEYQRRESQNHRTIGDLVVRLTQDMRNLVSHEMALARTEISEKISQVSSGLISLAIGGAIAYAGLLGLMAAAIFGLATVMDLWLSALIVGGVVAVIGVIMLVAGRNRLDPENLELKRTKASLREDQQWLKHSMNK